MTAVVGRDVLTRLAETSAKWGEVSVEIDVLVRATTGEEAMGKVLDVVGDLQVETMSPGPRLGEYVVTVY